MKSPIQFAVLCLPALSLAFPGMAPREDILQQLQEHQQLQERDAAELEKRQSILDAVTGVIGTVTGLLGSVAQNINPSDKRPEPTYTYAPPGPGDSRGPCPGLNLLANYGYLPRTGKVTFGQVVEAAARGFNMGTDLASLLATFAVLANGDIATQTFYLGAGPGNVGGLNRHSTVEADISPNREDYYLGCGDNHHLSSRLFAQNALYAAAAKSKQFDLDVMGSQWAANSKFSRTNNPYIYFFPFPSIVSLGAFAFYPNFFSNGTYRAGGVANYESISNIVGAKFDSSKGKFQYVPEKWPANWYRRSTPYGAVEAVTDILTSIYPRNPIPMAIAQDPSNLTPRTVICDIYMGINSVTPLALAGQTADAATAITWALSKLTPIFGPGTTLGCPSGTTSPNYYPSPSKVGGPLSPPSAAASNAGNNVYNKIYFGNGAPTKPQCAHSS